MPGLTMNDVDAALGDFRDRIQKLETRMNRQYDETEKLLRRIDAIERGVKDKGRKGFYAGRDS